MLKYSKFIVAILISLLIGFYLCIIVKEFTIFTINENVGFEINPLELISILINVFLAIYITGSINKKNESNKYEKELLINFLLEYKRDFSSRINELIIQENLESINTNANFKILRSKIFIISGLIQESNFAINSDNILPNINEKISEIWELFTDTPKASSSRTSVAIREEIERIRLEKISKIEMANIALEKLLYQLILIINKK